MATKTSKQRTRAKEVSTLEKPLAWILTIGSAIGLFASLVLTYDKLEYLKNPSFVPNCDLNPVVSCGDVMNSSQGALFGFPNSIIGIITFSVILTIGVALLAGATFKRWFWLGLEAGMILGVGFALWMLQQSIYAINALCPYCLTTDVVTFTMFWYTTLYLIESNRLPVPARLRGVSDFARRHHLDILVFAFVVIIAVILHHFWYYYGQYFS